MCKIRYLYSKTVCGSLCGGVSVRRDAEAVAADMFYQRHSADQAVPRVHGQPARSPSAVLAANLDKIYIIYQVG